MFQHCNFMKLGYFDTIHYDIFYDQNLKKQNIRLKKGKKESLAVKCETSKIYLISYVEKIRTTNTHKGGEAF